MLHILLCLQLIFTMTESVNVETPQNISLKKCPFTYYGKKYEKVYLKSQSDKASLCFNKFYDAKVKDDCILIPKLARNDSFPIYNSKSQISETIVRPSTIRSPFQCCLLLRFFFKTKNLWSTVGLCSFGSQSSLFTSTSLSGQFEFETQVNGTKIDTFQLTNNKTGSLVNKTTDTSRCRYEGKLYKVNTMTNLGQCKSINCSTMANLSISRCGPLELCEGNTCILDATCTVTGPTIRDFYGRISSISDRCVYPLLTDKSFPNFQLQANFQERRRKDVSFLDSVILRMKTDHIQLQQGGRARLNNDTLTLNNLKKEVKGVGLLKDQTGVTATLSISKNNITVFFDGYTAQIHVRGFSSIPKAGLCVNAIGPLGDLRLSKYSTRGCEKIYKEKADGTINCRSVNDRCNLLMNVSFAACHKHVDPKPYIIACNSTLCKYPSVDGLGCQFLEAYVRACSLHVKEPPTSWRSRASCSAKPMAYCQNKTCSAHEFCGDVRGSTRCLCRSIFADPYRSSDTMGSATVCNKNSASVTLVNCLLEEKNINSAVLHLNNPDCKGQMDKDNMVTFKFDSRNTCGTVVTANSSHVMFKNAIKAQNSTVISRQDQVSLDFSCFYNQPDLKTMSFKIKDSSVIQEITSGAWKYTLSMKAYTDAMRKQAVSPSTNIQLNQKIWVQLSTAGLEGSMVNVVTDSCWATNQKSSNDSLRYDLIKNGCANTIDQTVKVEGNGQGMSNYFSFSMFQFSGKSSDVYLHCKLHLCIKQKNCIPVCKKGYRRRRSLQPKYEGDAAAVITMAWGQ